MKCKLLLTMALTFAFSYYGKAQVSSNEAAARNWIRSHSKELNINPSDNFKLSFVRKSVSGETLRFQQMMNLSLIHI